MTITVSGSSITFADSTVQTTAAISTPTGGTTTSSGTDITLTSSSTQGQLVTMTTNNLSVILPDATTMNKGGLPFKIYNQGANVFFIKD